MAVLFIVIFIFIFTPYSLSQSCEPTEIQFSDDGEQLHVRFNTTVDTTDLLDNPSYCTDYFDEASLVLLSDSLCSFSSILESNLHSISVLLIDLSSTAAIQYLTDELTLVSNAFGCINRSVTLEIDAPDSLPDTEIVIDDSVLTTIGSCETFTISAYSSTGTDTY